ncbi:MAG TPA: HigA family addiction module antitoxin [Longimicrobium sp.]|jgi:addiction module HigA family antidote
MRADFKPFSPASGPDFTIHPGEVVQELMEYAGLTQVDLAERTGRPKKTINEIIQGKAAITPETALQLERVLGVSADHILGLEQAHRSFLARKSARAVLADEIGWLKEIPLGEMIKRGWVKKLQDKVDQLEEVLRYFGVASPKAWAQVWAGVQGSIAYRRSTKFDTDFAAVATWLRQGEILASDIPAAPYDARAFRAALAQIRALTSAWPFQEELVRLCAEAGVVVLFVPEIKGLHVSGATRWLSPEKALIQLTLRGRAEDLIWFSFFHEAAHILLHGKRTVFVEPKDTKDRPEAQEEREANDFAGDFLIPPDAYRKFRSENVFSAPAVQIFAREIGVSPGIVVGRLQHDGVVGWNDPLGRLKRRFSWTESDD